MRKDGWLVSAGQSRSRAAPHEQYCTIRPCKAMTDSFLGSFFLASNTEIKIIQPPALLA